MFIIKISLLIVIAAVVIAQPNVDFNILLANNEYILSQLQCVAKEDPSKCDRIGTRLRDILLPVVAKTGSCDAAVCTATDLQLLGKSALKIKKDHPQYWDKLLNAYNVAPEIRPLVLKKEMDAVQGQPK